MPDTHGNPSNHHEALTMAAGVLVIAGVNPLDGETDTGAFVVRAVRDLVDQRDRARATLIRATQIESLSDDDYDFNRRVEADVLDLEAMETAPLPALDPTETDL